METTLDRKNHLIQQQLLFFKNFMTPKVFDAYAETTCAIGYISAIGSFLVSNGIYLLYKACSQPTDVPTLNINPTTHAIRISNIVNSVTEEESQQEINP